MYQISVPVIVEENPKIQWRDLGQQLLLTFFLLNTSDFQAGCISQQLEKISRISAKC